MSQKSENIDRVGLEGMLSTKAGCRNIEWNFIYWYGYTFLGLWI